MRLSIAGVFGEAWSLYSRFAGRLIVLGAIVFGFLALVQAVVASTGNRWLTLITVIISLIGIYWLQGALVLTAGQLRDRKLDLSIGEVFERVEPFLWRLVAAGILIGIGVGACIVVVFFFSVAWAGVVLGIASLILTALWIGVVPAIVLERRGVLDAFRRSHRLVRGDLVRVIAVVVLSLVFTAMVAAVIRALFTPLPTSLSIVIGGIVANSVTVPFVSLTWTITYLDLRLNKDGPWKPVT